MSLFGGVNIETGEFLCMETDQCHAKAFLQFLQYTLDQYPDQHVVMVLDNAKIQHAKVLPPFLQEHEEQLTFVFLPPYSPNLNVVERIWGWLKRVSLPIGFIPIEKSCENRLFRSESTFLSFQKKCSNASDRWLCRKINLNLYI